MHYSHQTTSRHEGLAALKNRQIPQNTLKFRAAGDVRPGAPVAPAAQPLSVIERGASMTELAHTLSIPEGQTLKDLVQEYERQLLLMALELAGWNQRRVAASLGLLPSTLSEKMKRLGLRSTRPEATVNDAMPSGLTAISAQ
jgi:DNA-binding NtrC family response regulator